MTADGVPARIGLRDVLVQWSRIGCIGFGGPPTHIALLRELCVERRRWMEPDEFEDAIAACNLLPGPASTQLAILCAWNVAGPAGAFVAGLAFIVPGLIVILGLAAVFLAASPPTWVLAAGAGAGAAVAVVAAVVVGVVVLVVLVVAPVVGGGSVVVVVAVVVGAASVEDAASSSAQAPTAMTTASARSAAGAARLTRPWPGGDRAG